MGDHTWDLSYTIKDTGSIARSGHVKEIPAASSPTQAKCLTFLTALKTYMNGGVHAFTLFDWEETLIATPTVTPVGVNSDKLLVLYQYADGDTLVTGRLFMPNPDVTAKMELVPGEGYRLTAVAETALATLLSTASGLTITVIEGKLISQTGSHAKTDSSVIFQDAQKVKAYMAFPLATNTAAIVALAASIDSDSWSRSATIGSVFLVKDLTMPDPTTGIGLAAVDADDPKFTCVESAAYLKFWYLDGEQKKFTKLILPSVKNASCYTLGGKKDAWRFVVASGVIVATAFSVLLGATKTVKFQNSRVPIKNLKTQL